jgi:hypothetical protein
MVSSAVQSSFPATHTVRAQLIPVVEDQSGKEYKMDHYQVRFPTNVSDIGRVLYDLSRKSPTKHRSQVY